MRSGPDPLRRRAERALRWYPKPWRERYGDEFAELLVADLAERPRSWPRSVDVALSGLVARSAQAGLGGMVADPEDQAGRSLAALGCALAAFLVFGGSMWAQLATGGRWTRPAGPVVPVATTLMSATIGVLVVLGVLAGAPVVWATIKAVAGGRGRVTGPMVLAGVASGVLVAGSRHFANHWPGTGGHALPHLVLIPAGVAAFAWAATLSVTSYWAHVRALSSFPPSEIAWMALSPVALVGLVVGAAAVVRRVEMTTRVVHYEAALGRVAAAAMLAFVVAASSWIAAGDALAGSALHAGTIDRLGLVALAATLAIARGALNQTARAHRRLLAR